MQEQLSIMHVVLEPRYSGAETLVRDLAEAQIRQGHRASITAFNPSQQSFSAEMKNLEELGCKLFVPQRPLKRWGRVQWINAAVRAAKPDIIFAHSILPSLYTRLAFFFTSHPVIVTVLHTDDDFGNSRLRGVERLVWRRHATVVGVSLKSIENYRRRITERVPLRVIQNGIRVAHFADTAKQPNEWREKLYRPLPEEIIIAQVGRISLQKQQHVTIEALGKLKERGIDNVRIVFVGLTESEEYYGKVVALANQCGVAEHIQILGPRADIAELLAGADLYLMPSGWEAHSIAALEALASGIYCIFSGIDAFADLRRFTGVSMLSGAPNGEDLASCLEQVLVQGEWKHRYERDLTQYSSDRCAEEYLTLTRQLLN